MIDLGCGRGEWLEMLGEQTSFNARGVDLDSEMLAVCEKHQLQCELQDAISCLSVLEDSSQSIISGFHIAEHMPFTQLQAMVQQAYRVLKPAGLLILETPNPENIVVGTADFYMDPTHQCPIPPNLLAFVTEYYQFKRTKIVRLQETVDLLKNKDLSLLDVLKRVSPDYAVIAQKKGPKDSLAMLDDCFEEEYGLTLDMLATRYEENRIEKITQAEEKTQAAEARTRVAEAKTLAAELKTQAAIEQLYQIQNSSSWQVTAPLRQLKHFISRRL